MHVFEVDGRFQRIDKMLEKLARCSRRVNVVVNADIPKLRTLACPGDGWVMIHRRP